MYAGFDEDFATVNPYLGSDGVKPFTKVCTQEKKGIFVLVKTSNPSSGELQDRLIDGRPLYEYVGEQVAAWGDECMPESGNYSYVGAVVGATYPEQGKILRKLMPKAFILVPGYGAQGGKGADLVHFLTRTAWEPLSILPGGSLPLISRRNTRSMDRRPMRRRPGRRCWICERTLPGH